MNEILDAKYPMRTWAYVGLLQGLCGSVVLGALGAVWSVAQGEWVEALATPLLLPCAALTSVVTAIAGYPIFSWRCKQRAAAKASLSQAQSSNGGS